MQMIMAAELMLTRPNLMESPILFQMAMVFYLGVSFLSPAPHIQAVAKFLMRPSPLYFYYHHLIQTFFTSSLNYQCPCSQSIHSVKPDLTSNKMTQLSLSFSVFFFNYLFTVYRIKYEHSTFSLKIGVLRPLQTHYCSLLFHFSTYQDPIFQPH